MQVSVQLERSHAGDRDVTLAIIQDEEGNILSTGAAIRNPADNDSPITGDLLAILRAGSVFSDFDQVELLKGYAIDRYQRANAMREAYSTIG